MDGKRFVRAPVWKPWVHLSNARLSDDLPTPAEKWRRPEAVLANVYSRQRQHYTLPNLEIRLQLPIPRPVLETFQDNLRRRKHDGRKNTKLSWFADDSLVLKSIKSSIYNQIVDQ